MLVSKCGRGDLGEEPEVAEFAAVGSDVVSVEEPDMHLSETRVKVSLNENRAGGRLSGTDVLCGTISTLGADRGWVKISAEASDERKVEAFLYTLLPLPPTYHVQCPEVALTPEITAGIFGGQVFCPIQDTHAQPTSNTMEHSHK